MPPLAVSTCWNSHRHVDGMAMLKELAGLGFESVELSHGVKITLVEGILRAAEKGMVRISSCHNFCPLPPGITSAAPNLYMPSSRDPRERAQWARHTRRSIEFAAQVGSPRLVLHLGRTDFFWFNPAARLEKAAGERHRDELLADPSYVATLAKARARMLDKSVEYWANVKQSLREMLPYAAEKRVRLCFENRERFDELPVEDAFGELFTELAEFSDWIGYWHDTGHATLKHDAGVIDRATHLAAMAPHLTGFHLHDVSLDGRDHQPVGTGIVDWNLIYRTVRPHHQLVLELSPRVKPEEVLASSERIQSGLLDAGRQSNTL